MTEIDEQQCPLCLGPNSCGNTETGDATCWCFQESMPDELLKKLPEEAKGRLCICQQCLNSHRDAN